MTSQRIRQRQQYAAELEAAVAATGEDPLLIALRTNAATRDGADALIRQLIAYGRHFTGQRPDYTWEVLAEAGGLTYSTARRAVTQGDIDQVKVSLADPRRWPAAVANLQVHRAHAALEAFGLSDPPQGLDADAEYTWWQAEVERLRASDARAERDKAPDVYLAVVRWRQAWLDAIYPRAQHYRRIGTRLQELAKIQHDDDPVKRHVPDEAEQLADMIDTLTELRDQLAPAESHNDEMKEPGWFDPPGTTNPVG